MLQLFAWTQIQEWSLVEVKFFLRILKYVNIPRKLADKMQIGQSQW